jgi:hypothetical protein
MINMSILNILQIFFFMFIVYSNKVQKYFKIFFGDLSIKQDMIFLLASQTQMHNLIPHVIRLYISKFVMN